MKRSTFILVYLWSVVMGLAGCGLFSSNNLDVQIIPSAVAGKPPLIVRFEALVSSKAKAPLSYQWHFGDGQTDLGQPALHRYIASGVYKVNLVITDALGNIGHDEQVIKVVDFSRNSNTLSSGLGAVVSADFNSDLIPDLAVANRIEGNISVLLGQDDGRNVLSKTIGNGSNFSDLIGAYFDQDGLVDLAVTDLVNSVILVFASNGRGAFKSPTKIPIFLENSLVASGPSKMATGDFNGDGLLDVVTINQSTDNISVLFGNGEGQLALAHVFAPHRVGDLSQVQAADIDHDGLDDVVLLNQTSARTEVFLGRGDGTFVFHLEVAGGELPSDLVVADLDGDGAFDIAMSNRQSQDISLWWGTTHYRFDAPGRWQVDNRPDQLLVADVDGDGQLDLIGLDRSDGTISVALAQNVRLNNPTRAFERPFKFELGATLDSLYATDLNGDGQTDFALSEAAGNLDVLFNLTPKP